MRPSASPATHTYATNIVPFARRPTPRVTAPPDAAPIVLFPGFANDAADYARGADGEPSLIEELEVR